MMMDVGGGEAQHRKLTASFLPELLLMVRKTLSQVIDADGVIKLNRTWSIGVSDKVKHDSAEKPDIALCLFDVYLLGDRRQELKPDVDNESHHCRTERKLTCAIAREIRWLIA